MTLARVLRFVLALVLGSPAFAFGREEPIPTVPEGPFNNEYKITVELDTARMTLVGKADVTFRNLSDAPVEVVPFHLYPNAWAHTQTKWIQDVRGERRILLRGAEDGGYMRIASVKDALGGDANDRAVIDETVMRVRLASPLAPGEATLFSIEFETKLPHIVARMGKFGSHVNAMQWFPKLCAHENGRFVDWPFRNPSEFFASFGVYEVAITVPEAYVVDATGVPRGEPIIENGKKTVTYDAKAVHDFAWCASPNFIVHRAQSESGVEIVLLSQPFLETKASLILDVTKFTIDRYAEWFFPYPYPRVVIDVEPHGAGGGMEYPMLFTISSRTPEFLGWIRERSEDPAGVTVHEFSHQYWYGLVATNEFEEAWLDEGITTYVTYKVMEEFYRGTTSAPGLPLAAAERVYRPTLQSGLVLGRVAGYPRGPFFSEYDEDRHTLFGFSIPDLRQAGSFNDRFFGRKDSYQSFAADAPLKTLSWDAYRAGGENAYRTIAYSKPCLMLRTLEGQIGWERMRELLRTWTRRYAFRHPTSEEFIAVADEVLGGAFHDFLHECIYGSETIDFAVEEARSFPMKPAAGFELPAAPGAPIAAVFVPPDEEPSLFARVTKMFERGTLDAEKTAAEATEAPAPLFASEVVVRNRGRLWLPATVRLRFDDGSTEEVVLDERKPWYIIRPDPRAARLVEAVVDPDRTIALDLDVTNNGRLVSPDRAAGRTFASFYQFWVQGWLSGVAWFS